jgi:hypothetical protein
VRLKWLFLGLLLSASAQGANSPAIFFTDLLSGPNAGGESVSGYSGAYVTIYGNNFGVSPRVTWNGLDCLRVVSVDGNRVNSWMWYQKIVVQFGSGCKAGTGILLVTASGQPSVCLDVGSRGDGCRFTVRSGRIYFVSRTGNDNNKGNFASPWRSILKARDTMAPGDITYAENGICQCTYDGGEWFSYLTLSYQHGAAGKPLALIVYPGASATIGTASTPGLIGIRSTGYTEQTSYWVFAEWTMRAEGMTINPYGDSNWRLVGNDLSCPMGDGATGCVESSLWTHSEFLGNNLHDAGRRGASAEYHGLYLSTDSNHIEIAWNSVADVLGCRGIQIHSTPLDATSGSDQYDISIHDNVVHDTQCDAIVLATVDPSKGPILVYNNVIFNAGKGNTREGTGTWFCVYSPGYTNRGAAGSGSIEVYNNTMYNCGANSNPPYGGSTGGIGNGGHNDNLRVHIRNNIIYSLNSGAPYWVNLSSNPSGIFGNNNIMYGIGAPPSNTAVTGTIRSDPSFVSRFTADFHLAGPHSPANRAGDASAPTLTYDHDGLVRPSPPSIGAYEFSAGVPPTTERPQ